MGAGSRQRSKERRAQEKRKRKEINRTQYAEWTTRGVNQKSYRNKIKEAQKFNPYKHTHRQVFMCGNLACKRCEPIIHATWKAKLARMREANETSPS